jgi:hypothetical protein
VLATRAVQAICSSVIEIMLAREARAACGRSWEVAA